MDPLQISLIPMAGVTIDVDNSLLIQVGIMLVLVAVLKRLIFDPYLQSIEARDAKTDSARQDAGRIRERADALAARYESGLAEAKAKALGVRQDLRVGGLGDKERTVGDARKTATSELDEASQSVQVAVTAARGDLDQHAKDLSRQVVEKVLGRGV
jgi:F-type H+-transporting ATPase subunit b